MADGGTPRRVASLRAAPNILNKEPWTKQGGCRPCYSRRHCCSPSDFSWRSKQWLEVRVRQSSAREAVRPCCLPGLRGFKAEQSTPEGHKTPSPSIAVSRGGCADCGSGGRERRPLRLIKKKMTTTTTKKTPPSLQMKTWYSLRTKEVQMYQPMTRDRCFFPTHHMQSHFIIRRAAPEQAAWPTAPLLGATTTPTLLPTPSHHLSHQPQLQLKHERVRRGMRDGEQHQLLCAR